MNQALKNPGKLNNEQNCKVKFVEIIKPSSPDDGF